jgi:hypothetical protein
MVKGQVFPRLKKNPGKLGTETTLVALARATADPAASAGDAPLFRKSGWP